MSNKRRVIYVDFKDMNNDETCVIKCGKEKKVVDKSVVVVPLIREKAEQTISIRMTDEFFFDRFYYGGYLTGVDVYKFIIVFPNGDKTVIKNVSVNDPYYEELKALCKYRTKIVLKKDEVYPDFPKPSDYIWTDDDSKKRK